MTSRTLRRRLHHGDVGGKNHEHFETSGLEGLDEPLLGNYDHDDKHSEGNTLADNWDDERKKEHLHWTLLFSQLIAQWAQWLANIVVGSGTLIGRLFPFHSTTRNGQTMKLLQPSLSPLQEERLRNLQRRLQVPFDGSLVEHQEQDAFQSLLHKRDGSRAEWEYPFAVAGINLSFMLVQMLDLQSGKPTTMAGIRFLELLSQDEMAFDNLYCVAFQMMDAQWLAKRASYMEFNDVLKSTRTQLERELALEDVFSVRDLPAYNLLKR
ncbi:Engulfment and cell motility protein [Actinidia chinensis var. chinensis]|uniref:Engulfment and cell motility protein n=1 Tax=Actinidia chinensis var. chinensis TaxID=1590841 RepID=A0A2R6Q4B0_ACTCC|nr:Engulfment and cell motility protein [Actinidia chinensis var. chinensis]